MIGTSWTSGHARESHSRRRATPEKATSTRRLNSECGRAHGHVITGDRCGTLSFSMATALSILLIEDHEDAREAMRALLELDGHAVEAAADGPGGIALLRQSHPDVALIDIGLPGMDGYEVARRIRTGGSPAPF